MWYKTYSQSDATNVHVCFTGWWPNEVASELLEWTLNSRSHLPASGAREGRLHPSGYRATSEYVVSEKYWWLFNNHFQNSRSLARSEALLCSRRFSTNNVDKWLVHSVPSLLITVKLIKADIIICTLLLKYTCILQWLKNSSSVSQEVVFPWG